MRLQNSAHLERQREGENLSSHTEMAPMAATGSVYQNISFHKDSRELATKLKDKELD